MKAITPSVKAPENQDVLKSPEKARLVARTTKRSGGAGKQGKQPANEKCVLVAHRGGAKYFQFDQSDRHLTLVESLIFPKGKLRAGELDSDRAGRSSRSTKPGSLAVGAEPNSADHEEVLTAKKLADFVAKHIEQPGDEHLIVAAGPHLLGQIRKVLSRKFYKNEITFLAKDLAKVPDNEIFEHMPTDF